RGLGAWRSGSRGVRLDLQRRRSLRDRRCNFSRPELRTRRLRTPRPRAGLWAFLCGAPSPVPAPRRGCGCLHDSLTRISPRLSATAVCCAALPEGSSRMNPRVFLTLLVVGCTGIVLSFLQARSRAGFARNGLADGPRRVIASLLLTVVLLLTVAIPFAGGLAGGEPETKKLSIVSLFGVHALLALFLMAYFALTRGETLGDFLMIRSSRPVADLSVGVLLDILGWALAILALLAVGTVWLLARR